MSRYETNESIRPTRWRAAQEADGVEVFSRADLIARFPAEHFERVERMQFHLVVIGERGRGTHEVDFAITELQAGRVLHIEPGQVHRWRPSPDFDATLVVFPEIPAGLRPRWALGPRTYDLSASDRAAVQTVLDIVEEERTIERSSAARHVVTLSLRDLLFVRLGLDTDRSELTDGLPAAYVAFRDDLESDLQVATKMSDRAARVGYSARTISRACQEVSGQTAKQLTDQRIVLEAQRLLVQPGAQVSQVATRVGFTEQTNFSKYFRRHTSYTPSEWIAQIRG